MRFFVTEDRISGDLIALEPGKTYTNDWTITIS